MSKKNNSKQKESENPNSLKGWLAALALRLAGKIPLAVSQRLGVALGSLMLLANTREVKIARRNLELCFPELGVDERVALLKQSFLHSGMQAFEIAYLWHAPAKGSLDLVESVVGEEHLREILSNKNGLLLILPHLGNWEVVNAFILQRMKGIAMYTPARLPEVDKIMRHGREKTGLELAEANKKGVVKLLKTLNAGGNLFILPDQEPDRSGGAFAPFFGRQALTMTLISKMLSKSQASPLLAYAQRLGPGKGFRIVFRTLPEGIRDEDLECSLTALNQGVEDLVRESPEQYMWGYKRFRRRPKGDEKLYKDLR